MTADPTLLAARARALAARQRLDGSLASAKARLTPRAIASVAVEAAKTKAAAAAEDGVEAVRRRPGAAAAALGALTLVVARKPLIGWVRRRIGRDDATSADDAS